MSSTAAERIAQIVTDTTDAEITMIAHAFPDHQLDSAKKLQRISSLVRLVFENKKYFTSNDHEAMRADANLILSYKHISSKAEALQNADTTFLQRLILEMDKPNSNIKSKTIEQLFNTTDNLIKLKTVSLTYSGANEETSTVKALQNIHEVAIKYELEHLTKNPNSQTATGNNELFSESPRAKASESEAKNVVIHLSSALGISHTAKTKISAHGMLKQIYEEKLDANLQADFLLDEKKELMKLQLQTTITSSKVQSTITKIENIYDNLAFLSGARESETEQRSMLLQLTDAMDPALRNLGTTYRINSSTSYTTIKAHLIKEANMEVGRERENSTIRRQEILEEQQNKSNQHSNNKRKSPRGGGGSSHKSRRYPEGQNSKGDCRRCNEHGHGEEKCPQRSGFRTPDSCDNCWNNNRRGIANTHSTSDCKCDKERVQPIKKTRFRDNDYGPDSDEE